MGQFYNRESQLTDRRKPNSATTGVFEAVFIESKRQQKSYDEQALLTKVAFAIGKLKLKGYSIEHKGVSLETLDEFIKEYPPVL